MKLIYISHWRYPSAKVNSRVALRTGEEFVRHGFDVEFWVPWRYNPQFRGVDPFEYHRVRKNFTLRRLPAIDLLGIIPGSFGFYLQVISFALSISCYAFFRRLHKTAVFYSLDIRDMGPLLALGANVFFEIHDFYRTPFPRYNRFCFRRARGLISTNTYKMGLLKKEFGIPDKKMLHRPNAVDLAQFKISVSREEARKSIGVGEDIVMIFYCGQLVAWKGVFTLLEAARFLAPDEKIYVLPGSDEPAAIQNFLAKRKELGAENVVVVEGKTHKEIPLWLCASDVLALPNTAKEHVSKYETSPVKLFEYMASGRPIVASDLPSIRNVVDEHCVWFFEPDNPRAFADGVHTALARRDESRQKALRAQEEVEQYSWERRFSIITKFIHTSLGGNQSSAGSMHYSKVVAR